MSSGPHTITIALTNAASAAPVVGTAGRGLAGLASGAVGGGGGGAFGRMAGRTGHAASSAGAASTGKVGATLYGLGKAGEAAEKLADRLDILAEKYRYYSPDIAKAHADTEVQQLRFDIEQARTHGARISQYMRVKKEFDIEAERLTNQAFLMGAPTMTDWMRRITSGAKDAGDLGALDFGKFDWRSPGKSLERLYGEWVGDPKYARPESSGAASKTPSSEIDTMKDLLKGLREAIEAGTKLDNPVDEWMRTHPQLELDATHVRVNSVITKEAGIETKIPRGI